MNHRERMRSRHSSAASQRSEFSGDAKPPQSVKLHIDELVVDGIQQVDRYRLGDTVQNELARMLREQGTALHWSASTGRDRADGGEILTISNVSAEKVGIQVAHAVYRGLGQVSQSRGLKNDQKDSGDIRQ